MDESSIIEYCKPLSMTDRVFYLLAIYKGEDDFIRILRILCDYDHEQVKQISKQSCEDYYDIYSPEDAARIRNG
jgi:hypothetical protein